MADTMVTKIIEIDVKASADASAHLKSIAEGIRGVEESSSKAGNALQQLTSIVKGFVGFQIWQMVGDKVLAMASAFQTASDQSKLLEQRMILVTKNSADAGIAFQNITDIAVRQGRELDAVAKLYERVQRSSEQMGVTQKGVALITEGVAASLRLAGSGTQEANAAMLQFSQALASGKFGGDEFRSMMENDSVLMKAFADALGTTMGGLRALSKEGKFGPEELQTAMLKMGADGQNVMQRMIEQAAQLPKTWDQGINTIKASLVDYVNALQDMGSHTQSFLVTLMESFSNKLREMAQTTRDQAVIANAIAKSMGSEIKPEEKPEAPFASRRMADIVERIGLAKKQLAEAETSVATLGKTQSGSMGFLEKLLDNGEMQRAKGNVAALKGELQGLMELRATAASQDESDTPGGGFISGKAQGTPGKVAKVRGTTDVKLYKEIMAQLDATGRIVDDQLNHEPPWKAAAENLVAKLEGASNKLMTDAQRAAAEARITQKVKENYITKAEVDFEHFLVVQEQKDKERQIAEDEKMFKKADAAHDAAVKKITDTYRKEHLSKDPFVGGEEEVDAMMAVWRDSRTTQAQADVIEKAVHAIREKAAKQLLGEKDPLKDVAHQMGDVWESEFDRMENDLLDFSKSVKDIFGDMVLNILKDFAKIEMKQQLQPIMQLGKDWMTNTATPFLTSLFSATGNMFEGGVRMFAQGAVLSGPTPFTYNGGRNAGVGGEAGPEALVPLRRGADGNLGMAQAPVQVIIQNNGSNTKATATETTTPGGGRQITVMINDMVEASLGSGRFDNTLSKSFGISRKGT